MAKALMKFGIKASILTGAVYYTIDQGLWEDTEKADQVYNQIYQAVSPYVSEVPVDMPELPSTVDMFEKSRGLYNRGVIKSVNFIKDLPATVSDLALTAKYHTASLFESSSSEVPVSNPTPKPA